MVIVESNEKVLKHHITTATGGIVQYDPPWGVFPIMCVPSGAFEIQSISQMERLLYFAAAFG